jgi:hypothetical protein
MTSVLIPVRTRKQPTRPKKKTKKPDAIIKVEKKVVIESKNDAADSSDSDDE